MPDVAGFFDPATSSVQYVVSDPHTGHCAIIDPVLDFEEKSGSIATHSMAALLAYIQRQGLALQWILDTHPHADHFSAAATLRARTGVRMGIGAHIVAVQRLWQPIYALPADFSVDGAQWDRLFAADDELVLGRIRGRVLFSPGHTLASVSYVFGDAAFIHDTLFMPDCGAARADFPGGSAAALWRSISDIMALPDQTRLFTGHDYRPGGRSAQWQSTVAQQRAHNPFVAGQDEASFIAKRQARDATLPIPRLLLQALQVNIAGGRLPPADAQGRCFLKIPLGVFPDAVWR